MKKEKIYIFDLDHTIFNAKEFKKDLQKILGFENSDDLSEKIWKVHKESPEKIENILKNDLEKYLFKNIKEEILKLDGEIILLTWGDFNFQKTKVQSLGLDKVFDRVYFTAENKIHFLEDFLNYHQDKEICFINDNYNKRLNENKAIAEKLSEIKVFEVDNYENTEKSILNILKKLQ
ncbi:hypothetical protein CSB11_02175 [Candidatus Campbellbacteria bacterium]|nr:MAG: hypothetical protein CSB11_02175 [Candidatus Campbellbacteria bacterium]